MRSQRSCGSSAERERHRVAVEPTGLREDEPRPEIAARIDDRDLAAAPRRSVVGAGGGSGCASSGSPSEKSWSFTEMMSAKSASASSATSISSRSRALVAKRDPLLHAGADEALARDRDRIARQPVGGSVPEVEGRPEVLDAPRREEERGGAADPQHEPREEARVVREEAARVRRRCRRGRPRCRTSIPRGSCSMRSASRVRNDPAAARLCERLDHDLVDVHVQRARERRRGRSRRRRPRSAASTSVVRRRRLLGVALEADERELGLRASPGSTVVMRIGRPSRSSRRP